MSELGYPLVGPNSMWDLHFSEWRVLAEGLRVKNERQEYQMESRRREAETDGRRSRPKGRPTAGTKDMVNDYAREIELAKAGKHPEQLDQPATGTGSGD